MAEDRRDPDVGGGGPRGDDYEYDEAHDMPAGRPAAGPDPRPVRPPRVDGGAGGDYGYDEAHDLGR